MKKPINTMDYHKFFLDTRGYQIIETASKKSVKKIEFFWKSTNDEILDLIGRKNESYQLIDSDGWHNGYLVNHNFYDYLRRDRCKK